MPLGFFDSTQQRAALLITVLGVALIVGLLPFTSGLLGGVVLYVVVKPVHVWLTQRLSAMLSAVLVIVSLLAVLLLGGIPLAAVIATQAQQVVSGVFQGSVMDTLSTLKIGGFAIGPALANVGNHLVQWIGQNAFSVIGTATQLTLNLVISLFVMYYLLLRSAATWAAVSPYIPFSSYNVEALRVRFWDVTASTIIGTGLTAFLQGCFVALGFLATGLPGAAFWGMVTVVLAILPVVGSGMVWVPGVATLIANRRPEAAAGLFLLGLIVVANVDLVVRPLVFRRYAHIHPLVTLVGAVAGLRYLGLLGLLVGPLAISYFFELIRMYKEEYLNAGPA